MKKSVMFSVRMSPLEYEALKNKCKKYGVPVSDFVRLATRKRTITVIEGIPKILNELNRIGNNINQIYRAINEGLLTSTEEDIKKASSDLAEMKKELFVISKKIDICQ